MRGRSSRHGELQHGRIGGKCGLRPTCSRDTPEEQRERQIDPTPYRVDQEQESGVTSRRLVAAVAGGGYGGLTVACSVSHGAAAPAPSFRAAGVWSPRRFAFQLAAVASSSTPSSRGNTSEYRGW